MSFSTLNQGDRLALIAAVVVTITALVSVINDWGAIMLVALLGGLGALAVLLQPQLMPAMRLPGSRGTLLLIAGGVAAAAWIVAALSWLDWILGHLVAFDTLQFLVGLVFALILAWAGWQAFNAEGRKFVLGAPGASAGTTPAPAGAASAGTAPAGPAPAGPEAAADNEGANGNDRPG